VIAKPRPKVFLGKVLDTTGALDTLREAGQSASAFLQRHVQGD
jgi:hypothetical protein